MEEDEGSGEGGRQKDKKIERKAVGRWKGRRPKGGEETQRI
jgi:hypothetical protein